MKMEEMMMSKNEEQSDVRYCKKCGCELVSANKHKLCDNCRRKRNAKVRNGIGILGVGTGSFAFFIVKKGKHGGGNKA